MASIGQLYKPVFFTYAKSNLTIDINNTIKPLTGATKVYTYIEVSHYTIA